MLNGKPLVIDGYCGLGGWSEGFLAEGWECVGIDIERHDYGSGGYPGKLILQDMLTVHGKQFKDADCLVFSPPCQEYSYMAMPWSRAKAIAVEYRSGARDVKKLTALFDACFRIQREAIEAAGHFIPMVVENVRGAQPWVGKAAWNYGSFYLWGNVPALMPITMKRKMSGRSLDQNRKDPSQIWGANHLPPDDGLKLPGNNSPRRWDEREVQRLCDAGRKNEGGSWFNIGSPGQKEVNRNPVHELAASGFKTQGMNWSDRTLRGQDFTRIAGQQSEGTKNDQSGWRENGCLASCNRMVPNKVESDGVKQGGISGLRENGKGDAWFQDGAARSGSKSNARKAASATIAKIPLPLARWIAKVYYPK